MTRIIMHGCNGHMGQVITGIVALDEDAEIVAGIDIADHIENTYPVFKSIRECDVEADVVIDFSTAKIVDSLHERRGEEKMPAVLCTPGLTEGQRENVKKAAEKTAVLKSANMSLGINLLMEVLEKVTKTLSTAGFDIEIVEKHHNQKIDAPSGTALALADAVNDALPEKYEYEFDRSRKREKRTRNEIGISAVRGGTIVGEHEVIFAGTDEVVTLKHTAYSKAIFAKGSVQAAKYLKGKAAGLYDMSDVIKNKE